MKKKRKPKKRIGTSLTLLLAGIPPAGGRLCRAVKKPVLDTYAVVSA